MELLADTITSIMHGPDKLTSEEIKKLCEPYLAIRARLDKMFAELGITLPGGPSPTPKKSRKSGGGSGKKKSREAGGDDDDGESTESRESRDHRLNREANEEVRLLGFKYHKIPISHQLEALYLLIRQDLDKMQNSREDTSSMKHDCCSDEIATLVSMNASLNKMILAVKYRMGVIFYRHEKLSDEDQIPFNKIYKGTAFTDWREYYSRTFSISSKEIEQLMRFADHVNLFPGLVNSDKSWSWMKEHMASTRLQSKIQLYYQEKWETVQDVNEFARLKSIGYDLESSVDAAAAAKKGKK